MTGVAGEPPLMSLVLPVHGVEDYLPACLDSVLGQSCAPAPAIEVIAVDDASTDRCGDMLDERAAADPRLRVVHRTRSAGPGQARNLGLSQARGEYVWFVDPDDLLAEGALAAVGAALARQQPDVLLIDYLILHPSGRTEPSPGAGLLRERSAPSGGAPAAATSLTLALADHPALIDRTMTSWSKVFRREYLIGLRTPFPPGIHEDVPVSCAALLGSRRIALLDRVCYLYRQRRRSFLATPSMAHFAIFGAYEAVFARMDAAAAADGGRLTDEVRTAVFGRAMEHYSTVLASGLVPLRARRDFFRRMARDFQRHRPPGYRLPAGPRGLKMALIARGAYWAYEALAPMNEARIALRRVLRGR